MPNETDIPGNPPGDALTAALMNIVLHVPPTREHRTDEPEIRAKAIARLAARKASMTAGALSLPPGALGWLTVVPEMMAVWKIQAQMVADIAGLYGQEHTLGPQQMLFCLFKQASAQLLRDLAVRVGERALLQKISVHLTQRILKSGASRLVPFLGAIGVGAYAYADTLNVARNAVALFEGPVTAQANGYAAQ
jgi:uncharacterized protein (DUF697 family)